jgi:hypothetical protein
MARSVIGRFDYLQRSSQRAPVDSWPAVADSRLGNRSLRIPRNMLGYTLKPDDLRGMETMS